MLPKADHVGSVSGATVDKSEAFACRTHNPTVRRKKPTLSNIVAVPLNETR